MNGTHRALITYVRDAAAAQSNALATKIAGLPDDQFVRMMFSNYRGREESRGLRLTNFGLQVMARFFRSYEIAMPEGHQLRSPEILYLDGRAKLPYYVTDAKLVVFEGELGMKLKLADGDINTLIEIESN